ncbi:MAG: multidrug ABC transporter ATP-binding protein [Candidatus Nephthysia bennettiae]|uniref:ABC transporter ATP-binding protein n=1 Tax=Candidatus Nephthysia bennettiae TaxID=3127016 RepID=A0A934K9Y1_9BACT|nr:ABC transporter ATP-binding protein [Candidatus Dormibacteraeota bacterium]MBJ7612548.1 ABC transporter ATP-binding protein [Candidatus Dormibacteraeota bacterium]PZR87530.1 MAG: multidrug ABC transporter ATP-binding protein [Candidatus Dormibacteraeota bacterium]
MKEEAVVELLDAHKRYGSVEALKGVNLAIRRGELVAMLGPNGAGKTTSIALMLGLRKPTSGQARLFGLNPRDRRARSHCGVMLQESGVPDTLRVVELVDLFRSYYPNPMPAQRAIEMAGLEEQASKQAQKLSGGQRQRLYFALAVCGDPEVIFLDEPTVGMDVEARRAFLGSIRAFAGEGKTIVLTTHYLEEADELAERVIVIDRGVVVADAPPAEIKSRVVGKQVSFAGRFSEADFKGLPYSNLEVDGERVRLLSSAPEELLRELFRRGAEIRDLQVVGADLEEAFLDLTRHAEKEMAG